MTVTRKMRTGLLITVAIVLSLSACSTSADGPSEMDLEAALASISRDNIQSSVTYLAADEREGRMTGSRGYDDAARFVADQFEAMGLEPGGSGGNGGWYQEVPLITRKTDIENSGVTLHKKGGDVVLEWGKDVVIYADRLREKTRVRAEVVFVGFGIHAPELGYSDLEGIDVSGKIVAYFSGAPDTFPSTERAHFSSGRTKADELVNRGAIGEIGLMSRAEENRFTWSGNRSARERMAWIDESGDVADFHPELLGSADFRPNAARQLFEEAPITLEEAQDAREAARPMSRDLNIEVSIYRTSIHERMESPNVIGILRGSDPKLSDEYLVYSTHLDHLGTGSVVDGDSTFNGMYDNAIGVSVTLEIARAFASIPVPPRRSIMFVAVTAEERGLLGSDYFAHYPTVPREGLVASMNIDMPMFIFPLNTVTGYGVEHSSLEIVMTEEALKEGFEYMPDPYPEEVYFIRSDQYSFVRQGIPSMYLAEGIGSSDPDVDGRAVLDEFFATHYHARTDDLSQPIVWETALRFTRAGLRIGFRVAMEEERPTWKENNFFGDKFGR